jgi:hypothetical protein
MPKLSYQSQPLQNHSFRGQDLTGIDFSGANLRGCSFHSATLRHANFDGAVLGRSIQQWFVLVLVMAIAALLAGHAATRLIFAALGASLQGTTGILVMVLHGVLMAVGLAGWTVGGHRHRGGSRASGALLGFFYVGSAFNDALIPAIVGAIAGAVMGDWLSQRVTVQWGAIALTTVCTMLSISAVFLLGTTAIAGLAVQHWIGVLFSSLTGLYLWLTYRWGRCLEAQIEQFGGTSFRSADLTDAVFHPRVQGRVDFTDAIALPDYRCGKSDRQSLPAESRHPGRPQTW